MHHHLNSSHIGVGGLFTVPWRMASIFVVTVLTTIVVVNCWYLSITVITMDASYSCRFYFGWVYLLQDCCVLPNICITTTIIWSYIAMIWCNHIMISINSYCNQPLKRSRPKSVLLNPVDLFNFCYLSQTELVLRNFRIYEGT